MIEPSLLRYFYAVATEGNFTKAALKLRIGQPVVSQMVKNLEERLGVKLFERQKRHALPTREGVELLQSCKIIFDEIERTQKRIMQNEGIESGKVNVGSTEAISDILLPSLFDEFLKKFPGAEVYALSGPTRFLADMILKNETDFAFGSYYAQPHPQIEVAEICQVRHHIVASVATVKNQEWKNATFISSRKAESDLVESQPAFQLVQKKFSGVTNRMTTNSLFAHKQMVANGRALAILPSYMIHHELKNGKLKDLFPKEHLEFPIRLLKRKSYSLGRLENWLVHNLTKKLSL